MSKVRTAKLIREEKREFKAERTEVERWRLSAYDREDMKSTFGSKK